MIFKKEKKKVLVADDEKSLREMLAMTFRFRGFLVFTASNGKEVVEKALSEKPDFILLDVMMPEMDGFEALRLIRQDDDYGKNVPVIFLTNLSADSSDTIEKIAKTEPIFYIIKNSFSPDEIVDKVKEKIGI